MPDKNIQMPDGSVIAFPDSMADTDISAVLNRHSAATLDPLTAQTQAAAHAAGASTGPAPLPVEMQPNTNNQTDPSGNLLPTNIAQALNQSSTVQIAQNRAANSPTPVTNAIAILAPMTAARQIVGGKAGAIAGSTIAPHVGVSKETGSAVGGLLGSVGASLGSPESSKEWQAINESIGAKQTSIRLPKSATSIEDAATIPARGLQAEGFDAKTLNKMTHIEQQAAVAPKWNDAGKQVDRMVIDATAKNVTVNPSKSALEVASSIQNPKLRDRAVKDLSGLMEDIGITDASKATPLEVLQLRRALRGSARFGPNGDLSSLGGIRAQLYSAVSNDLHESVDGLKPIDQHYSDLDSAIKAINASARKEAVKAPRTLMDQLKPYAKGAAGAGASMLGIGSLYEIWKKLGL